MGHGSLKLLVIASSRGARGRTLRGRRGGGGALLSWGCSSTGLGLLSVPLDLVLFPMGMLLVFVLPRHDDTGQGPEVGVQLGRQALNGLEEGKRNFVSTYTGEGRPRFKPSLLRRWP